MQWDIGLDLGESAVRLATRQKGVALTSPSWGALRGGEIIAIGDAAYNMLGRNPAGVTVEKPIASGMIDQPRLVAQWISRMVEPFVGAGKLSRPGVVFADSGLFKTSEKELMAAAALEVGAQAVGWADADILAAAGAGVEVMKPKGHMVAEVGAGVMSACVVSYGRVVCVERLPWGVARVDRDAAHQVRSQAALSVGPRTAEEMKLALASALPGREMKMRAVGLDLTSGFPLEKEITAAMIRPAVEPLVDALANLILSCIEQAPEELSADIYDTGVVLTGGGALLSGLDEAIRVKTGMKIRIAETPELAVIKGMAAALADPDMSEQLIRA